MRFGNPSRGPTDGWRALNVPTKAVTTVLDQIDTQMATEYLLACFHLLTRQLSSHLVYTCK